MIWKLDQTRAEFRCDQWHGTFDLAKPELGLKVIAPNKANLTDLLGVAFQKPNQPMSQDCFVRQGDLIAVYPPREMRKFHVQLDYRMLESTSERLLVELWISVQTYLLDNHPVVSVQTPFDALGLDVYNADAAGTLVLDEQPLPTLGNANALLVPRMIAVAYGSFPDTDLSIAWLNHPRDQFDTTWSHATDKQCVEARLFGHFMEKGVIRRARMRCLISSQPLNQSHLQEVYDAFITSPLPLTA